MFRFGITLEIKRSIKSSFESDFPQYCHFDEGEIFATSSIQINYSYRASREDFSFVEMTNFEYFKIYDIHIKNNNRCKIASIIVLPNHFDFFFESFLDFLLFFNKSIFPRILFSTSVTSESNANCNE